MVYYSDIAKSDLKDILWGLANWKKHPLSYEHAANYVDDIRNVCDNLEYKSFHFASNYETHRKYGKKSAYIQAKQHNKLVYKFTI